MRSRAPLGSIAKSKKAVQRLPHQRRVGMTAEISIEETKSLGARQKASDGAIEMYQVEHPPPFRDYSCMAKILEVHETYLPFGALAAREHQVGLLKVEGVEAGIVKAADFPSDGAQGLATAQEKATSAGEHDLAHDARVLKRLANHVACADGAECAALGDPQWFRPREACGFQHRCAAQHPPRS